NRSSGCCCPTSRGARRHRCRKNCPTWARSRPGMWRRRNSASSMWCASWRRKAKSNWATPIRTNQNMSWPEAIALKQPLRDVRMLIKAHMQDWQEHLQEREQAAFENGRREGERALGGQLLQQRNELVELQNGILNSLQQTLPRLIQENETALMDLA